MHESGAALRREQWRLLLTSVPVLLAAYFVVGALGSFAERPWAAALLLLPVLVVVVVLGRPLVREQRLLLGGGFLWFFVAYCLLFSIAAGTRVLEGRRVVLSGFEAETPSNVLGLNRLGDWHYLVARPAPPAPDLLVITLPSFEGVGAVEARRAQAALIGQAVEHQARGIAFDYYFADSSDADRILCFWIQRAESAGVPVIYGYRVQDPEGVARREPLPAVLRDCLRTERLGALTGVLEADLRVRMVPTSHLGDPALRSFSFRVAELLSRGVSLPDPGLVQFVTPAGGITVLRDSTGEPQAGHMRDRFVIVGSHREGDVHDTPFGRLEGVLIHAFAAHALRTGTFIHRVDVRWILPVIFLLCYLLTLLQARGGGLRPLLAGSGLILVGIITSAALAMRAGRVWIDASYPILAVGALTGILAGGARLQGGRTRATAAARIDSRAGEAPAVEPFHVFLSHNSRNKEEVRALAEALRARGLRVWLDEWELVPGRPWQEAIEQVITTVMSAAVLVGRDGLGPWEEPEMRACLDQCVRRRMPVIPVLLPGAPAEPKLPIFLTQFTWVDLRDGLAREGVDRLQWGITGIKPDRTDGV